MSMNPRATTDKIRTDYEEYLASILNVRSADINRMAREKIRETEFVKGPYLETTLPFRDGHSLKELAEEGLISREFSALGKDCHYEDWKLRIHQEEALRHIITDRSNMIVSTGTGSGKTECYLYPIFNALMREKENGTLGPGVRALLIFPMNALANDQQKKLRKLLRSYPDITFGRYTGETPWLKEKEDLASGEARLHEDYDLRHADEADEALRKSIPNEYMSRNQMIETPPHILLTNYAMLEYLLLQPDTAAFFDGKYAESWKFIVIDEAHTYKGASGTEIAFLLRRVKERIRKRNKGCDFTCIATSATLSSASDGAAGLAGFASQLFGEKFAPSDVITTVRKKRARPADARAFRPEEYVSLRTRTAELPEEEREKALYEALKNDLRLFSLYEVLKEKPGKVREVANAVFADLPDAGGREAALIDLIELSAAAKPSPNESALLPARYHLFVKSLEGMFVQFYPEKHVFFDRRERAQEPGGVYSVFEMANCKSCEQEYIVGTRRMFNDGEHLVQTGMDVKPEYYFISDTDEGELDIFDEDDLLDVHESLNQLPKFHLCLCCGRITPFSEQPPLDCCPEQSPRKIRAVYQLVYAGSNKESNCCPCCGHTGKSQITRFLTSNQPATFAIAKSLYEAIPPRGKIAGNPEKSVFEDAFDDPFGGAFEDSPSDPESCVIHSGEESGRKLLIFSDNRQEAAFFAGFFEKRYNLIMWRKVILRVLKDAGEKGLTIDDLIARTVTAAEKAELYTVDREQQELTADQKEILAAHYIMQEFRSPNISTGLEGIGQVEFYPVPPARTDGVRLAGLAGKDAWLLLRAMMDTLRQKEAVSYPEKIHATDSFFAPRNHYGYFHEEGSLPVREGHIYGYLPAPANSNRRLGLMQKLVPPEITDPVERKAKAREYLKESYKLLIALAKHGYLIQRQDAQTGIVYCLNYQKWMARSVRDTDILCRCRQCRKLFPYAVGNLCPETKCRGTVERLPAAEARKIPYYSRQYQEGKLIPMVAREHTAQLSAETARVYQEDFEKGKINVLSCSTTFEMGVDVGELEATFLRDVPPETSNYIQRAGRAGRRTSSAAFCVTFARRTSHDMTYFQNPEKIISGSIRPPMLETGNEIIARRHLNSIVVAWFFRNHPEFFQEKAKRITMKTDSQPDMAEALRQSLQSRPQELLQSIHAALPDAVCDKLKVDDWAFVDDLTGDTGRLTEAIENRQGTVEELRKVRKEVSARLDQGESGRELYRSAKQADELINTLDSQQSIAFLSGNGVLPKYGFPIDTVKLDILGGSAVETQKIDLSRDLRVAISEFAPPAEIVANGKLWKSYAINKSPEKGWPTYIYRECPNCKRIYPPKGTESTIVDVDLKEFETECCKYCGSPMKTKKFIIPLFGFSTSIKDAPRLVGDAKPGTYYMTRTQFWEFDDLTEKQKKEVKLADLSVGGKPVHAEYSPGGRLFVLNQGTRNHGFRICTTCGYCYDPSRAAPKKGAHSTKTGYSCSCKDFQTVSLGHHFSTDVLRIRLPYKSVETDPQGKDLWLSVLYALLEGASSLLDIDRTDINGCLTMEGDLILYDDTPGGSGFVKEIFEHLPAVLAEARKKMNGDCGCASETSCYGCLRNYTNQFYHDKLSRGLAWNYLSWLSDPQKTEEIRPQPKPVKKPAAENPAEPALVEQDLSRRLKSRYKPHSTAGKPDTAAAATVCIEEYGLPVTTNAALERLIECSMEKELEHPLCYEPIALPEGDVFPLLFWGKARVAIFADSAEDKKFYDILSRYDWYCFMADDAMNAAQIADLIEKAGK